VRRKSLTKTNCIIVIGSFTGFDSSLKKDNFTEGSIMTVGYVKLWVIVYYCHQFGQYSAFIKSPFFTKERSLTSNHHVYQRTVYRTLHRLSSALCYVSHSAQFTHVTCVNQLVRNEKNSHDIYMTSIHDQNGRTALPYSCSFCYLMW